MSLSVYRQHLGVRFSKAQRGVRHFGSLPLKAPGSNFPKSSAPIGHLTEVARCSEGPATPTVALDSHKAEILSPRSHGQRLSFGMGELAKTRKDDTPPARALFSKSAHIKTKQSRECRQPPSRAQQFVKHETHLVLPALPHSAQAPGLWLMSKEVYV